MATTPDGQPVQAVDEVHRVDRGEDDDDRHGHENRCRQHRARPEERDGEQLDPLVGHDAGRQDLAGQLGQPVQLADVVDGADADRRSPAPMRTPEIWPLL